MFFILNGIDKYKPQMQKFTNYTTRLVKRCYSVIGNVTTLLLALPEVFGPKGRPVNSISDGGIVATIEKEGMSFFILLSFATALALLIALIYVATKDCQGRVLKIQSEAKNVIDLLQMMK